MRLVMLPTISIADYNRDSDFFWFHKFAKKAVENGDFVYFLLPLECEEFFEKDEPGIKYLFFRDVPGFYYRMKHMPPEMMEWFSHGDGYYFADALITSRNAAAFPMASALAGRNEKCFPTFNFENIVRFNFFNGYEGTLQAMCYGLLPNWFCSPNERTNALSIAKSHFIERVDNDYVGYIGGDIAKLDNYTTDKKFPDFTVFFGGRINEDKNFEMIASVMEFLHKRGSNIKFVITTPHDRRGYIDQFVPRLPFVEWHFDTPRELFYKLSSKAHVNICASKRDSYALGWTEQTYLTGIGVFPNDAWATTVFNDLAYYANSVEEYAAIILDIQANYEKYAQEIPERRRQIAEHHNGDVNYQKVYEWVVSSVPKHNTEKYGSLHDLKQTVAMMSDEFDFRTFAKNLPPILSGITQGAGRAGILGYSPYGVYKILIDAGICEDTNEFEYPVMRKVKDEEQV